MKYKLFFLKVNFLAFILFPSSFCLYSQTFPQDYFRSPVDFKIYLSGTFGEPRSTHYHTGLDIKTQGVEGKKIYAVADGYVSRISISPFGYGNVIYITHPNGYTSVYAHLSSFNDTIENVAKQFQYDITSFQINEENLPKNLLPIKKGEVIGFSGNSGGSGGPHLHFEIRDSLEKPINPLLFGFDKWVTDNARPDIYNIAFYNLGLNRQFTNSKIKKPNSNGYGKFGFSETIILNEPEIGLGIHSVDRFTGVSNKNGVYEIKLYDNDSLIFHSQMNKLDFEYSKHVYSQCDYYRKKKLNQTIYKCFKEKGNKLPIHNVLVNNGKLNLSDYEVHNIKIVVADFHRNESAIELKIKYEEGSSFFTQEEGVYTEEFLQGKRNTLKRKNVEIEMPNHILFDDLYFYFLEEVKENSISNGFQIHQNTTPVSDYFLIKIRPNKVDSSLLEKYTISFINLKNRTVSIGGNFEKEMLIAKTRDLGYYFISIDTIKPKITPLNIYENKTMTNYKTIRFKATDNFSGIEEYNAFINGCWVLLEYDAKRASFTYHIDEMVKKGKNKLELIISDERANAAKYEVNFNY